MATVRLMEAHDRHFAWMAGAKSGPIRLTLPPGGIETPDTIGMLRGLNADLRRDGCRSCWMIVVGREVVGLCSFTHLPDGDGAVEFGYGIAASRRDRGFGTAAVTEMVKKVKRDRRVSCLVALTATNNFASMRVLERNGFEQTGTRIEPNEGLVIVWQRQTRQAMGVSLPARWSLRRLSEVARLAVGPR
jgi:RimJ/RimL family protein N-acetyltransferase